MGCMNYVRALLVRILFACHGIMAIWRLYMVTGATWSWYLGGALFGLFIETLITIAKKRGHEWKWFCPSVFFYLLSVVPAIWFLELYEIDKRIELRDQQDNNSTNVTSAPEKPGENITKEALNLNIEGLGNFTIPIAFSADLWLRVLEQFLLLMLIVGRWILPKGSISHNQLSQLLLVYVGTAADIVEFYEAFSEDEVKYNRQLCYIILGIWTLSLLQFTMVLTATKARRDHVGLPYDHEEPSDSCCNPELYGIMTSIILQDLPFLCIRLMLIFWYHVVSYTNMFFTSKNSLVIILLIYRLVVVNSEARRRRQKHRETNQVTSPLKSNGHHKNGRPLKQNRKSKGTPNMYITSEGNNTLPRRARKKDVHSSNGNKSSSTLAIPTVCYSDPSCQVLYNGQKRQSASSMTDRRKSATSSENYLI